MGELSTKLFEKIMPVKMFEVFGIRITDTIITMWIVMAFLIITSIILTRNLKQVPDKKQSLAEVIVDFINGVCKDTIGHHWKGFAPYIGTIMLFLAFSNTIAIFNIIPEIGHFHFSMRPPTKDITIPASMAVMSIVLVLGARIKYKRPSGFVKGLFEPIPIMFPFNVMEYFIKPLSLCLRLFGNILAAFIIMELIYFAVEEFVTLVFPVFIPGMMSMYFDIFDGLLQAFIFTFLTSLYIGEAVE